VQSYTVGGRDGSHIISGSQAGSLNLP
jgi:hypothetical protein